MKSTVLLLVALFANSAFGQSYYLLNPRTFMDGHTVSALKITELGSNLVFNYCEKEAIEDLKEFKFTEADCDLVIGNEGGHTSQEIDTLSTRFEKEKSSELKVDALMTLVIAAGNILRFRVVRAQQIRRLQSREHYFKNNGYAYLHNSNLPAIRQTITAQSVLQIVGALLVKNLLIDDARDKVEVLEQLQANMALAQHESMILVDNFNAQSRAEDLSRWLVGDFGLLDNL